MSAPITEELLREAIDRVARTADGRLFYLYLQRRMMAVSTAESESALRQNEGERTFAGKLIGLMAKGISESGGRAGADGKRDGGEEPIVFAVPEPIDVRRQRGAGRRVTEDTIVPGWNDRKNG